MNHILEDFYKALGDTKNVKEDLSSRLSNTLEIVETKDLGKYLSVPLLHKKVSQATFTGLVEKVKDRARNWLANRISLAGRITLPKSVLSSIPIYLMQSTHFPKGTYEVLDKICRAFVWGSTAQRKAPTLVSWDKVCQPKENV